MTRIYQQANPYSNVVALYLLLLRRGGINKAVGNDRVDYVEFIGDKI